MKNILTLLMCTFFILATKEINAQNLIKIGPSILYNYPYFDEFIYKNYGGEISYEVGLKKRHSFNVSCGFHIGYQNFRFAPAIRRTNIFVGVHPEYRFHFEEVFDGGYFGIGVEGKYFKARNRFPPRAFGPEPTYVALELNAGFSVGFTKKVSNHFYINPTAFFGFGIRGENEYGANARIGVNLGFMENK